MSAGVNYSYFLFPRHHTQALCTRLTSLLAWLTAGWLLFLIKYSFLQPFPEGKQLPRTF